MSKLEHPYSEVNLKGDHEKYLYNHADIHWVTFFIINRNIENYTITQKLGRGKYSHVF